jgi:ATP-dependent RNA helicase RhlE
MTEFLKLNLAEPIAKALASEGYTTPTPIQEQAIPVALAKHDVLGIAQTGTGKTAAFALPILDRFYREPKAPIRRSARALILAPTRELAGQIAQSFRDYGRMMKLSVATVFGGARINPQIRQMDRGVDVLVATPGRLIDLIEQGAITLAHVEILVLDEADQMLDLGFIHALRQIVPMLPKKRQTLFFSATMPKTISDLAAKYLTDPVHVSVAPTATTVEKVRQSATFVNQTEKQALLTMTLREPSVERALVFSRTKHGADRIVKHLAAAGIDSSAIHGNKSQPQRERALEAFRKGQCKVLVATDIAARGIDVDNVSHVINFEIPNVPEQYVHRIGRTARAGAAGRAISFVANDERPYLRDIERVARIKMPIEPLPADFIAEMAKLKAARPSAPAPGEDDRRHPRGTHRRYHNGDARPSPAPGKKRHYGGRGRASARKAG